MISPRTHAALDGLSAAALALAPGLLGWRRDLRHACAVAGAGVAAYSMAIRYRERSDAPLSMRQHLASARALAELDPELLVTGHGRPMAGPEMRAALHRLADRFDEVAVPDAGRYARHPARPEPRAESGAYR